MKMLSRILVLAGAAAVAGSVTLPWAKVTSAVPGISGLDFDLLGAQISEPGMSVSGTDTKAWPAVVAVGGVIALLALLGLARKLLLLLGVVTTLGGAALLYYVLNVVDIKTEGNALQPVAQAALDSSAGAGPMLLLAGGLAILIGALIP
ncbi:MAG TPA: hypothetical protein VEG38_12090 [Acidimicrobiia bacterium]|nr:hypothetical protein [Acidimicrobiia bacterium]